MHDKERNAIVSFFNYKKDSMLNQSALTDWKEEYKESVYEYINEIISFPVSSLVEHIKEIKRQPVFSSDVFQFSDFDNATINLCSKLKQSFTFGLTFDDVGKLISDHNVTHTAAALKKYGENHIKMAQLLGLAFKHNRKYYLSPLGLIYNELESKLRSKLLIRLILRSKLIVQLLSHATKGEFDMETFLYDLSKSTYQRRKPNIKFVLEVLNASDEFDFSNITTNIKY